MAPYTAVVVGGTGQTGRHVVKLLAASPLCSRVTAIVRKQLKPEDVKAKWNLTADEEKKVVQTVVNFDKLDEHKDAFKGHDKGFCLLGTTRSQAGSAEAFRKVDYDYVLNSARLMKDGGVQHYSLMTSQGSNKDSWFLYPKTKGEVEEACGKLAFPRYSIFRPGMLLTDREESRPAEWIFQKMWPNWMLPHSAKATPTEDVARAIVTNAERSPCAGPNGLEEYATADIRLLRVGAEGRAAKDPRLCVASK